MDNVAHHLQRLQLGYGAGRSQQRRRPRASILPSSSSSSLGGPHAQMRRLLARSFCSSDATTFHRVNHQSGNTTPVFQLAFARGYGGTTTTQQLLAAVDEDGVVSIIDTSRLAHPAAVTSNQDVHVKWQAHDNAIFDLSWSRDNSFLLTASGDLKVCAWDLETQRALFILAGSHSMSVKCVRQCIDNDSILATGARDGNVLIWDARTPRKPVAQLVGVHSMAMQMPSTLSRGKAASSSSMAIHSSPSSSATTVFVSPVGSAHKRRRLSGGGAGAHSQPRSVTSVEFTSAGHELITAGAVDGVVKFWDLRRITTPRKIPLASATTAVSSCPLPVRTLSCSSRAGVLRGVTSLALDHTRSKLLVNVLHDELCMFDIGAHAGDAATEEPLVRLNGHVASSFYVRSTFSPDGDFVLSGSGDGAVYMWDATGSSSSTSSSSSSTGSGGRSVHSPMVALKGHAAEVNGVAWHASDFTRLATCSDDGTIRLWTSCAEEEEKEEDNRFQLMRRHGRWQNFDEFDQQPHGRTYSVVDKDPATPPPQRPVQSPSQPPLPAPVVHRQRQSIAVVERQTTLATTMPTPSRAWPTRPSSSSRRLPPPAAVSAASGARTLRKSGQQTLLQMWTR